MTDNIHEGRRGGVPRRCSLPRRGQCSFVVRSLAHIIYTVPQTRRWMHSAAVGHREFEPRAFAIKLVHFIVYIIALSLSIDKHLFLLVYTYAIIVSEVSSPP